MSSTNKTTNLNLNSWIGSDIPVRADFNNDNAIIDEVVSSHLADTDIHINNEERDKWNNTYYIHNYIGNGLSDRVVETKCPFIIKRILVYANNHLPISIDFNNKVIYNYFGYSVSTGSTYSVNFGINQKNFYVKQGFIPASDCDFAALNESGTLYTAVLFR